MLLNNHEISSYVCHITSVHVSSLSVVNILTLSLVAIPCVVNLSASVARDLLPLHKKLSPKPRHD